MYYEINISLNGKHFFATNERSITNETSLKKVYKTIKEKFPQEEGYNIMVTYNETKGKLINMEKECSL